MAYNGYPNRATWNVSLWLNNDESLYRAKQDIVERAKASSSGLADDLEGFCRDTWPNGVTPDNDSLDDCDWQHLADNEMEDWEPGESEASTENEQLTLAAFIAKHDLKFTCRSVDSRPDGIMDDSARHFSCRIYRGTVHPNSYQMGLYFSQGSAHTQDPTLADVLDCLASDASGYENAKDFADWASEYGYDTDSRKAEKVYKAVKRQAEQLKRTIGDEAYQQLLWETERL